MKPKKRMADKVKEEEAATLALAHAMNDAPLTRLAAAWGMLGFNLRISMEPRERQREEPRS